MLHESAIVPLTLVLQTVASVMLCKLACWPRVSSENQRTLFILDISVRH